MADDNNRDAIETIRERYAGLAGPAADDVRFLLWVLDQLLPPLPPPSQQAPGPRVAPAAAGGFPPPTPEEQKRWAAAAEWLKSNPGPGESPPLILPRSPDGTPRYTDAERENLRRLVTKPGDGEPPTPEQVIENLRRAGIRIEPDPGDQDDYWSPA